MHQSVMAFVASNLPELGPETRVLEVGSRNVNGSVRPLFAAISKGHYLGIDISPGEGVDEVCSIEDAPERAWRSKFDVVISCEMLEHAADWQAAFRAMVDCLAPCGTLLLTTRGPGFPYHNPPDYWRFLPATLAQACRACGLKIDTIREDPQVSGVFLRATKTPMPKAIRIDASGALRCE